MGIIDPILEQYQNDAGQMEVDMIPRIKEIVTSSFYRMWESRETAEKHLMLLGSKATEAFVKHAAAQDLIEKYDPTWTHLTPPYPLEFNADGTVKIKE